VHDACRIKPFQNYCSSGEYIATIYILHVRGKCPAFAHRNSYIYRPTTNYYSTYVIITVVLVLRSTTEFETPNKYILLFRIHFPYYSKLNRRLGRQFWRLLLLERILYIRTSCSITIRFSNEYNVIGVKVFKIRRLRTYRYGFSATLNTPIYYLNILLNILCPRDDSRIVKRLK